MIKEAAIRRIADGRVWTGLHHAAIIHDIFTETKVSVGSQYVQGFITHDGQFVDRKEGLKIAIAARQVEEGKTFSRNWLYSEDYRYSKSEH